MSYEIGRFSNRGKLHLIYYNLPPKQYQGEKEWVAEPVCGSKISVENYDKYRKVFNPKDEDVITLVQALKQISDQLEHRATNICGHCYRLSVRPVRYIPYVPSGTYQNPYDD